ncbi:MAG TPA: hypothetical protein VFG63_07580 [Nocardioidaceae bacterium]|nr:hypothetical protein [Nocardioidaceae bacterium]
MAQPAMYCAGMTGHPCLQDLAARTDLPEWAQRAVVWWLREGPAIHEPAGSTAAVPGDEGPAPR